MRYTTHPGGIQIIQSPPQNPGQRCSFNCYEWKCAIAQPLPYGSEYTISIVRNAIKALIRIAKIPRNRFIKAKPQCYWLVCVQSVCLWLRVRAMPSPRSASRHNMARPHPSAISPWIIYRYLPIHTIHSVSIRVGLIPICPPAYYIRNRSLSCSYFMYLWFSCDFPHFEEK